MKIYISSSWIHQCNLDGLNNMISYLKWNKVDNINDADLIYSGSEPLFFEQYMLNKKFIYGPHMAIFPFEDKVKYLSNFGNSIYIQPSEWVKDCWVNEFKYDTIPVKVFPFPVDTDKYIPGKDEERTKVCIYYKHRSTDDLYFIQRKLIENNIEFTVITYGDYKEGDYLEFLKKTKYMILVTSHESQCFSNLCARACNVPLLVWDITRMDQEINCPITYRNVNTKATSVPYFDDRCGEIFYHKEEFDGTFKKFLSKLDTYKPRDYVVENLSIKKCSENLVKLINGE